MTRPTYEQLPADVRAAVERVLGSPVGEASSQTGGWSPGVAARVTAVDGRRAFVKAVCGEVNSFSPGMHRREAVVTAELPAALGSPRLLGSYDDGSWVALVLEDVQGREPAVPDDLPAVLAAVDRLADVPAPGGLRPAVEELQDDFGGWQGLAEHGVQDPETLLGSTAAGRRADAEQVTCLVAAFAGRMEEHARRPPPGGMPSVRSFQAAQAGVAQQWLRQRLSRAG